MNRLTIVLLLVALSAMIASSVQAKDLVELSNGEKFCGDVLDREEDGSLLLLLRNGGRRYIFGNEIRNIGVCADVEPETREPLGFSIYAGYSMTYFGKFSDRRGTIFNNAGMFGTGHGFQVGFDYSFLFGKFQLAPGLEMEMNWVKPKEAEDYYSMLAFGHFDYDDMGRKMEMRLNVPVMFGPKFELGRYQSLSILTGPCPWFRVKGWKSLGRELCIWNPDNYVYSGVGGIESSPSKVGCDWRFGVKYGIGNLFLGVNYGIGLTSVLKDIQYVGRVGTFKLDKARLKRGAFKVSLGVNF